MCLLAFCRPLCLLPFQPLLFQCRNCGRFAGRSRKRKPLYRRISVHPRFEWEDSKLSLEDRLFFSGRLTLLQRQGCFVSQFWLLMPPASQVVHESMLFYRFVIWPLTQWNNWGLFHLEVRTWGRNGVEPQELFFSRKKHEKKTPFSETSWDHVAWILCEKPKNEIGESFAGLLWSPWKAVAF